MITLTTIIITTIARRRAYNQDIDIIAIIINYNKLKLSDIREVAEMKSNIMSEIVINEK